jgi:hypothetical protein
VIEDRQSNHRFDLYSVWESCSWKVSPRRKSTELEVELLPGEEEDISDLFASLASQRDESSISTL